MLHSHPTAEPPAVHTSTRQHVHIRKFRAGSRSWHKARSKSIGGSDAAAALGIHPYKSAYELYCEKRGIRLVRETPLMRQGKLLEPIIAAEYCRLTGRSILTGVTVTNPALPFLVVNPDGIVPGEKRITEFKVVGPHTAHEWGAPGTDQVPNHYLLQGHHGLVLTDFDVCDYLALFTETGEFKHYEVRRNRELEEITVIELEAWHRHHIVQGIAPAPDGSDSCSVWLKEQFRTGKADVVKQATPAIERTVREYDLARAALKEAEARKDELANLLRVYMEDATLLQLEEGKPVTWRNNRDGQKIDYKALTVELMRLLVVRKVRTQSSVERIVRSFTETVQGDRVLRVPSFAPAEKTLQEAA